MPNESDERSVDTRLSDRFLVAFSRAEEALQDLLGTKNSFRWMLRMAAKRDPRVRSVEEDLIEIGELRNAIVHERGGGYVIAEPHLAVVERLEKIVDLLVDPPRVEEVMSKPVITCGPDQPVAVAAKRMVAGDFSRMPIYDGDVLVGLLTANALARWIATKLAGERNTMEEEPVGAILGYGEAGRRYEVVARDRLVAEVVELFTDATRSGRRIEAVLVSPTGSEDARPVGIVTVQDLPRMYALLGS
jgi:CBS domain-containing protein